MEKPANRSKTGKPLYGKPFQKGVSGNPSGRPKGTLKDYVRKKFTEMSDEDKEKFIKHLDPEVIWKMGEGNPEQKSESDVKLSGSLDLGVLFDKSKKNEGRIV